MSRKLSSRLQEGFPQSGSTLLYTTQNCGKPPEAPTRHERADESRRRRMSDQAVSTVLRLLGQTKPTQSRRAKNAWRVSPPSVHTRAF
jgi:hypothetical protein